MAEVLDGKKLAKEILEDIKKRITGKNLKLAVVLVGNDPSSEIFVREKKKACDFAGIEFELFRFLLKVGQEELKTKVKEIAEKDDVSGVVIQLPLPENLNSREILDLVPGQKDIDVLSTESFGKFSSGTSPILPPVVAGVVKLLGKYNLPVKDKNVVLVGGGKIGRSSLGGVAEKRRSERLYHQRI